MHDGEATPASSARERKRTRLGPRSWPQSPSSDQTAHGPPPAALRRKLEPSSGRLAPRAAASAEPSSPDEAPEDAAIPDGPYRAALRRRWAELIRRVYEVDPLVCPRCGSEMRVTGFITQPAPIDRILDHLRRRDKIPRPPPFSAQPLVTPA